MRARYTGKMRWLAPASDEAIAASLAANVGISPVIGRILVNRGITDAEEARRFLFAGREALLDPHGLKGLIEGVACLRRAIAAGDKIWVYGDYDVDGLTGTAVLTDVLQALGAKVEYYIPSRLDEGYGLNAAALEEASRQGVGTIVTVDCGITAVAEAARARELGLRLVITDHHQPGPEIPGADAVINPKQPGCSYPFKELAGVGVAFKLALGLAGLDSEIAWRNLDLVTVGTIADMVPLVGENRALVREGLSILCRTGRPGLRALLDVAGVPGEVSAGHVSFGLAPRINALGRMGSARDGVELFLTPSAERAAELARRLDQENRDRQDVEGKILDSARAMVRDQVDLERDRVIILADNGWHHGVVGIVAARLVEEFHRPTILLCLEAGEAKGSARSIPGFNIFEALQACSHLLTRFGGHSQAAGLSLLPENIPDLRKKLNEFGQAIEPEHLIPALALDAWVGLEEISFNLVKELSLLEPHGIGNPVPVLAARSLSLIECRGVGRGGNHLKLRVKGPRGPVMHGIGFGLFTGDNDWSSCSNVDLAFVPEVDTWRGEERLQLKVRGIQSATEGAAPADGRIGQSSGHLPGYWAGHNWEPLAVPDHPGPECGQVIDLRNGPDRRQVIARLAQSGRSILVLCHSPWMAATLAESLKLPNVICSAFGDVGLEPGRYDHIVYYHVPYSKAQLRAGSALVSPAGQVYWLFRAEDVGESRAILSACYPDREQLVKLYRLVKELADAGKPISVEDLALQLPRRSAVPFAIRDALARAGVEIFRELGLVTGGGPFQLAPANGQKIDLELSPRFRRGQEGRLGFEKLVETLFRVQPEGELGGPLPAAGGVTS